jgi:putative transposase
LGAELTHHLGYEKGDPAGRGSGNNRNGSYGKTVLTEDGAVEIEVPRDRNGSFEPQIVPKGETRLDGFDDKIISLYARGLTVREIQGHLRELYAVDVSPDLISRVTDAVLDEVREWQNRPLDAVYPVVFFDALRVKIRDESVVKNKAIYLALTLDCEGHKHVLGLWIEQTEGAKFWLRVMNELKNRGVEDLLFAVVDGLKGFPDAITAVFPRTIVQTCIVHLIRHSLRFVSWQDRKQLMPALRAIYQAETAEVAEQRLGEFEGQWGKKYPAIGPAWRRAWNEVVPFFAYPAQIRKMIYTTDEIDKRFCLRRGRVSCAGDLVAKRGVSAGSAAGQPASCLAGLRHPRTFSSILLRAHFPTVDEAGVVALGLRGDLHLLVAQRLDVIGIGWPALIALPLWLAGLQFHGAGLVGDQRGARPQIILVLGQQMPAQNGELAGHGDGCDLVAPPGPDADEEGMERSSRPGCRPGRFDQHGPGMAATDLADAPVMSGTQSRLPHSWVQTKVTHQLPGTLEPADVADRRHDPGGDREVDACDRHQPLDRQIIEGALGNLAIEDVEIFGKPVEFTDVPVDGAAFVVG